MFVAIIICRKPNRYVRFGISRWLERAISVVSSARFAYRRAGRNGRKVAVPFSAVDLLQALSAGLLVGSAYALMCIGLGIIFGSMNVINFAQGDFLMLGMYAAFYLTACYGVLTFLA